MDPLLLALSLFRRSKFEECIEICGQLLAKNPRDQSVWLLKLNALTEQMYVDEVEVDEEGMAELLMDENSIADVPRPGTSLKKPMTAARAEGGSLPVAAVRPVSQSGQSLTGFVRPGTQSSRPTTMEQAIRTPRTAMTARPVTTASGRFVRLGTASMISEPNGPFVDVSRIDFTKYAKNPALAKGLFEYLFHHENDVRNALQLAAAATQVCGFKDWWWKVQLGKCYFRLSMYRDAERQFKSALQQQDMVDTYLFLGKVYLKLDHPLTAIDCYQKGLQKFSGEVTLLTAVARVYEGLSDMKMMCQTYQEVLHQDNLNVEATACLATNHFYNDQPEIALQYYRRLLQLGVSNVQVYNNLALSCYYSNHYDSAFACFERALTLASDEESADIWYNIGCVITAMGETDLAMHAFKLCLAADSDCAEAYNNLAVLHMRKEHVEIARSFFETSAKLNQLLYEPRYNYAVMAHTCGDLQSSFSYARKANEIFPEHSDSKELLQKLQALFSSNDAKG